MMNKTWFSYVVLSIGLMMLMASDKPTSADEEQSAHTVTFGSEQKIEIFVNKAGTGEPEVQLNVDGTEYSFTMPELTDGESRVITTEDGKEITIKSISGNHLVLIDGNEMNLPPFGAHHVAAEGLSAMISRTHQVKLSNEVTVSGQGLSEDVKQAIVAAIQGVLSSYDVDKKVSFSNNKFGLHVISEDEMSDGHQEYKFQFKTEHGADDGEHEMIIMKEIEVIEDDS